MRSPPANLKKVADACRPGSVRASIAAWFASQGFNNFFRLSRVAALLRRVKFVPEDRVVADTCRDGKPKAQSMRAAKNVAM